MTIEKRVAHMFAIYKMEVPVMGNVTTISLTNWPFVLFSRYNISARDPLFYVLKKKHN